MKLYIMLLLIYISGGYSKSLFESNHWVWSTLLGLFASVIMLYIDINFKESK